MQLSAHDTELMIFVRSLIKYTDGAFKTTGQRWFYMDRTTDLTEKEDGVTPYGVTFKQGERIISIDGIVSWAGYGVRSQMPVVHVAILDRVGVRAFYKLGGRGNLRDGWGPDPKKTKLIWERPAHVVGLPEEVKVETKSSKVGEVGEAITVEGTVIKYELVTTPYGTAHKFVIKDSADNLYMYRGTKYLTERGGYVKLETKVKDHFEMGTDSGSWMTILGGKGKNSMNVIIAENFKL